MHDIPPLPDRLPVTGAEARALLRRVPTVDIGILERVATALRHTPPAKLRVADHRTDTSEVRAP